MGEIKVTSSKTNLIYDEENNMYLDFELDLINAKIKEIDTRVNNFKYFTSLTQIGITDGAETIKEIADKLPDFSILVYHKATTNGNASIYPHTSGLLCVIKGGSTNRVSFEFSRAEWIWRGYYDNGNTVAWNGWKRINEIINMRNLSINSATATIQDIVNAMPESSTFIEFFSSGTTFLGVKAQLPATSGFLRIFKFYNTRVEIEFIHADNDTTTNMSRRYWTNYNSTKNEISKWGCVSDYNGTTAERPGSWNCSLGMQYFDTTLNKPIWWTGAKWVDANGSNV